MSSKDKTEIVIECSENDLVTLHKCLCELVAHHNIRQTVVETQDTKIIFRKKTPQK